MLVDLARRRFPAFPDNFFIDDAWEWKPDRTFNFVYTLYDCVSEGYLEEFIHRLLRRVVYPGGRLIIGAYSSRSENIPAYDLCTCLKSFGFREIGLSEVGNPPVGLGPGLRRL